MAADKAAHASLLFYFSLYSLWGQWLIAVPIIFLRGRCCKIGNRETPARKV
jgi:hypothetical protein